MTPPEFDIVFAKAKKRWPKFFSEEMEEQVFGVVGKLPSPFFAKRMGEILWADRAPKIDFFHDMVSSFHRRQAIKSELGQMHASEGSLLGEDVIANIKKYAFARIDGRMNDKDYADFQKGLREVIAADPKIKCKTCLDQGAYLPHGENILLKCRNCGGE